MSRTRILSALGLVVMGMSLLSGGLTATAEEEGLEALWYFSPGFGMLQFEGDEELEDGGLLSARLGYDYSEWWSFEGGLFIAPQLDENFGGSTDFTTGVKTEVSQVKNPDDAGFGDTHAAGLFVDALFHFTRWERLDPYLAAGGGFTWYGDKVNGETFDPSIRVGGGVMWHFNDEWAVRADGRTFLAGNDTEANAMVEVGVVWTWGARVAPDLVAIGGPLDSDGDGLIDDDETGKHNTDPFDPDTDDDGLTDGEEVLEYDTDPLNPDSDWDGLKDGPEVKRYGTNPNKRDTDDGGVADGHEVIEDDTNPLVGADDLMLFELNIMFDYNKAIIKPEYFGQLDIVGKVLTRNPEATAVIEGHADRKKDSDKTYNKRLSKRRASAALNYLVDQSGIEKSRLKAEGYGFERPKAPNDDKVGNPVNRRVEIYIRGATDESDLDTAPEDK